MHRRVFLVLATLAAFPAAARAADPVNLYHLVAATYGIGEPEVCARGLLVLIDIGNNREYVVLVDDRKNDFAAAYLVVVDSVISNPAFDDVVVLGHTAGPHSQDVTIVFYDPSNPRFPNQVEVQIGDKDWRAEP
jgi:hypothetical protein